MVVVNNNTEQKTFFKLLDIDKNELPVVVDKCSCKVHNLISAWHKWDRAL